MKQLSVYSTKEEKNMQTKELFTEFNEALRELIEKIKISNQIAEEAKNKLKKLLNN